MTVGVYPKQLSDGNPGGTILGQSAADLISLHGATPVAQAAFTAQVTNTASVAITAAGFGFSTTAQADGLIALVRAMQTVLINKGFMAAS